MGATREEVLGGYRRHVNRGLARLSSMTGAPIETRSEGPLVFDEHGEAMLDCGGYGVFILGHRHPRIVEAAKRQLDIHPVSTRMLLHPWLPEAAQALVDVTPDGLDWVYLANGGAEAVETALKLARLAGRARVIATDNGFHGKTLGALSVTGRELFREPFEPLVPQVDFVPFGRLEALAAAVRAGPPAAVIMEPVQAEGGVVFPPEGYLAAVAETCRDAGALLILDEIQTGLGRLGAWWGADRAGVRPDLLLAGKGLGGGLLAVSAVVGTADAFAGLNADPFVHSATFAGSPLASAVATATIRTMQDEGTVERARELGEVLVPIVRAALADVLGTRVREVRGEGLLIGIDCDGGETAGELVLELLHRRVIVSHSLNANRVVRLTPPAIIDQVHIEWLAEALTGAAAELSRRRGSSEGRT